MSLTTFAWSLVFFVLVFTHQLASPTLAEPTATATASASPTTNFSKSQSSNSARFLGKLSLLAGLGLPPVSWDRIGTTLSTHSDNPGWARPYVAAVYEPLSFMSIMRDPLGYLAAVLNPYNWFAPQHQSHGHGPSGANRPSDVLVLVNDVVGHQADLRPHRDEDRGHAVVNTAPIVQKIEQAQIDAVKKLVNAAASEVSTPGKSDPTTTSTDSETNSATQEATDKQSDSNPDLEDDVQLDSRQDATTTTTIPTTIITSTSTRRPPRTTTRRRPTTERPSATTEKIASTTRRGYPYPGRPRPSKRPHPQGQYYYGGRPQHVAHVSLTTTSASPSVVPQTVDYWQRYSGIGSVHLDDFEPPAQAEAAFDYNNDRLDWPSEDFVGVEDEFLSDSQNHISVNGFRPSFPFYRKL